MAQRVITTLIDDLDGKQIDDGDGETVSFALDGKHYTVDLGAKNAEKLRKALQPFIGVAKTDSRNVASRKPAPAAKADGPSAQELRDWGRRNGFELPDRGRIPNEVREAWGSKH